MKKCRRLFNFILIVCLLTVSLTSFTACEKETAADYVIAYTNSTNDDVAYYSYAMPEKDNRTENEIVEELITKLLLEDPEDGVHYSPLPADVTLKSYTIREGLLTLDFDEGYNTLTNVQEIMLKACVVLTLVQVNEVESILFTVNGSPVKDSEGNETGAMNPDQYVDLLLSDEELLRQEASVKIFFANEEGTGLAAYDYQFALDNQTQPLEEYIVRKLIEGPDENGGYPTLDPEVSLISIMTTDSTCYVNFTDSFLSQNQSVSDEIMVYSIVDSLTGLAYINAVQFLVDGESDVLLHKTMDLSKPLSRRFDLIVSN